MLEIGSLVDGKYKVLSKVGQGGMSVVYMAINEKANKTWAIKEVRKDGILNFEEVRLGLAAETEILKKLKHPHLPSIVDVIDTEDSFLMIMDYIEGHSLDQVLEECGPLPQEDVIKWAGQLCDVLGYLHSRQPPIIYRDMKPENIMLKPDGNVMLIDFGTAREFKEKNPSDTVCFGTVGYAAPEQFGGMGQTDARTDLYSLGMTLYHLVTGYSPAQMNCEIQPIREINPRLSSGLEQILLKCTRRKPKDRYQSAAELLYALKHYEDYDEEVRKRQRRKLTIFLVTAFFGIAFAMLGLVCRGAAFNKSAQTYQTLLQNAEETSDYERKVELYTKCMEVPQKGGALEAYLGLIKTWKENDQNFTDEEADLLEKLISNNRDELQKNPDIYAEVCYETGRLYWYYYRGNENKLTSAIYAKIWFQRVLEYASEHFENRNTAQVYYAIGEFYSSVAELQKIGEDKGVYLSFFWNLTHLMENVGKNEQETERVRLEMLELARSALQQYAAKFKRDGVEAPELENMLKEIEMIVRRMDTELELKETILSLLKDTKISVKTAYGIEIGGENREY